MLPKMQGTVRRLPRSREEIGKKERSVPKFYASTVSESWQLQSLAWLFSFMGPQNYYLMFALHSDSLSHGVHN